jgi:hypothetical protein
MKDLYAEGKTWIAKVFAMAILSFSVLGRIEAITPQHVTLDDLRPATIWQAAGEGLDRAWQRTRKFYRNVRFVYQVQQRLAEWDQQDQRPLGKISNRS